MAGSGRRRLARLRVLTAAGIIAVVGAASPAAARVQAQASAGWPQFQGLLWALAQPSAGGSAKAVALGPLTGHRLFSTSPYADDTQGFPPVVSAGHVYINLGNELLALALPASG